MKKIKKYIVLMIWIIINILVSFPIKSFATDYFVVFPKTAQQGTVIAVKISVADNPGLTTLGLRVFYNPEILDYKNAEWSDLLLNGRDCQVLVSDVEYLDGKAINIAMIDNTVYQEDGTMLTLYFEVLKDYSESPVTLEFRDSTDAKESKVYGEVNTVFLETSKQNSRILVVLWGTFIFLNITTIVCMIMKYRLRANGRKELQSIIRFRKN